MAARKSEPDWLSEQEMDAWLPFVRLLTLLPNALDSQLRDEAGISHVYYQLLAVLSAAPRDELRMSGLASTTGISASRLSHAVTSLEQRGWVERRPCPQDRRGQVARLTASGRRALAAAAPGHVAEVRRRVFDQLSEQQVRQLAQISTQLVRALEDPPGGGTPLSS